MLGSVYSKYFLDNKVVIEEKKEIMTTDKNESLNEKKENKIQYNKTDNISLADTVGSHICDVGVDIGTQRSALTGATSSM